ncbi:hypothetical protein ASPWEDRAFT_41755 [Aspergillus wentii DTO 134E9]|uniref:Endonuclease/exonuclease/phosphatase domain-containing protein n=1 Tax=Aspergillus wentii DTO 134E9 TaxID=1073089 RepID=A0A1L9RG25_ASPWE|nr:uncharacterized protein ASPWEDRAFT_41755 [Aspergillus wentii DTO 134E9]KAI9925635.1 hypothetical protein MW887_006018 [Aspergillus wentii]OJJ33875.1 hypothetical protein ASPWEDRAFT_41755 [Aspergillus wentii DTO 134E9]
MKPLTLLSLLPTASSLTISEINSNRFLSPHADSTISNIAGLVTATGPNGFYIRSTDPDNDPRTSESIYVYSTSAISQVSVGDIISLSARVSEYRSSSAYSYLTELTSPSEITVKSTSNTVSPLVLGKDGLSPPTEAFSALDVGEDGVLSVPNNVSQISSQNPILEPGKYGMDFWESLSGELVSVSGARVISTPNRYGDTWVVGDWGVSGGNGRGGLTMRADDSNPEAIIIGSPLDGTKNPTDSKLGDTLSNITGIITQAYGYYTLLPLTALNVTGSNGTEAAPTTLVSDETCTALSIGSYNVENLAPDSKHLPKVAAHIVEYLKSPVLVFLQEIQDDDGPTDDGVTSSNKTLTTLTNEIQSRNGRNYTFTDIPPINDHDGGQPGGNIRVAYLYDPTVIQLHNPNPGSNSDANDVLPGPELKFNPGLIDPGNEAWESTRKPLAAAWETVGDGGKNVFFTINVHLTSKGGSSSIEGDARPPVNKGVEKRTEQAEVVANFTSTLLATSPDAKILISGDFNEFAFAPPLQTLQAKSGLKDLDDVVGTPSTERYTYLYDANCQQLDHMFVSEALGNEKARMEHVHVNTWVGSAEQVSDHDPTVAVLDVCS